MGSFNLVGFGAPSPRPHVRRQAMQALRRSTKRLFAALLSQAENPKPTAELNHSAEAELQPSALVFKTKHGKFKVTCRSEFKLLSFELLSIASMFVRWLTSSRLHFQYCSTFPLLFRRFLCASSGPGSNPKGTNNNLEKCS